jgi:D-lactate dehydrogenase
MKIAFFKCVAADQENIKTALSDHTIVFYPDILDASHLPEETDFDAISIFVDSTLSKDVLAHFPNLKFIATRSTGFDHIDAAEAKERGIVISTVPSYGENTVAEHAFGLLLAISKRIYDGFEQVKMHGDFHPENLEGFDLKGKTLGVLGTGRIGRHSIQIGNGFGMKVIAYDAFPNKDLEKECNFEYRATLEDVLKESDVVTIHVPYMKETHHLLNEQSIRTMKKGAVLINTSRGAVVDTMALVKALEEKRLGGAGLDVLEEEGAIKDEIDLLAEGAMEGHDLKTVIANHALIDFPNVIITPHSAFNTKEAIERILLTTIENIQAYASGKPANIVS